MDVVFVQGAFFQAGNKTFPNTRAVPTRGEGMFLSIPKIEVTNHRNGLSIGRPHGKVHAFLAIDFDQMAAHFFINPKMSTRLEQVNIVVGKKAVVDYLTHTCRDWRLQQTGACRY